MKKVDEKRAENALKKGELEAFLAERKGLEIELIETLINARDFAWKYGRILTVISILSLLITGLVIWRYSTPLPPYLLERSADGKRLERITALPENISTDEAQDGYWASQFVIHYETYDYWNAQIHYDAVGLMASSDVADQWRKKNYNGKDALDKVLGDSETTRVDIVSVAADAAHDVVTIRYTKTRRVKGRPQSDPPQHFIATLGYDYGKKLMTAKERNINPLGFQVQSIDIHPEMIGNRG